MKFGFFSGRGVNEFINCENEGFYFSITKNGVKRDKFFLNVGQPNQNPSRHPDHKDDPEYCDDIKLIHANFYPFYAKYEIMGNTFEWIQVEGGIILQADINDSVTFHSEIPFEKRGAGYKIGNHLYIRGLSFEKGLTGKVEAMVSFREMPPADFTQSYLYAKKRLGDEVLKESPSNIAKMSVFYNIMTHKDLENKYYVPVNRTWTKLLAAVFKDDSLRDGPMIFAWDSSFSSIILAQFVPYLAMKNLLSTLETAQDDGRIPQLRLGHRISNHTNPPIWFLAAYRIYKNSDDITFIQSIYDCLMRNYRWFKKNRMNDDYTFSWGTDNEDNPQLLLTNGKTGAVLESGLDDSPLFDDMELENGKLNYACVDLSSLIYRAAEIMLHFSSILERDEDKKELKKDIKHYQKAIHFFFNHETGIPNSFRRAGKELIYVKEVTPLSFYPLLTSFISPDELEAMERLLESKHFNGTIPSLSYISENYTGDGDYWRGRIWPPMVFITAMGFKRYGSKKYCEIKKWAEDLLLDEWKRHHHIHENYSSITGKGEPQPGVYARSCPFYSWGGLMGII